MEKSPPPPFAVWCLVAALLTFGCGRTTASPAQHVAVGQFQEVLQQQTFFSVLMSIEERLKNLDNIYSMQLSQTIETKLDQYNRRLEALDTKIIRLEALVMLNLDKISENISTKNFKEDMSRTNLLRKMDSVYEGINHRLGYMDRKYETNLAKIETKVDATLSRLDKIEENMTARDSDIEAEISDVIFAVDDLKTTCTSMEEKLYNSTTAALNVTQNAFKYLQDMNVSTRKSMNVLHDNIVENLKYMNNRTLRHFKVVEDNNVMLKSMKTELKEDFNDYANKVADMGVYISKNSDTTDGDLKRIETFVNSTKTEVQNGVRSLMLQIGKIPNKEVVTSTGDNSFEEINKNLKTNFQRILTNQDIFLESCHRLQMDEAQIESEISDTLQHLIDVIEKKMTSDNDITSLERALKTHDGRIIRHIQQLKTNVISLFETYKRNNMVLSTDVKRIGNSVDDLSKLPHLEDDLKSQVLQQLERFSTSLSSIEYHINNFLREENFEKILEKASHKQFYNASKQPHTKTNDNDETELDHGTKQLIEEIFGPSLGSGGLLHATTSKSVEEKNHNVKKGNKKKKKKPFISLIDVRGNFGQERDSEYDNSEEITDTTTTDNIQDVTSEEILTTETTITTTDKNALTVKPNDTINI